jgi:hypothetical protein
MFVYQVDWEKLTQLFIYTPQNPGWYSSLSNRGSVQSTEPPKPSLVGLQQINSKSYLLAQVHFLWQGVY